MLPKDYQERTLNSLDEWSRELKARQEKVEKVIAALKAGGVGDSSLLGEAMNYPKAAWDELGKDGKLPKIWSDGGNEPFPPYVARTDSRGEPIPHVCLKIPTGGGKTFLGTAALTRLGVASGLVLWITPSKAIYAQTWAAFKDKAHPYRERLEHASGGRVKLLTKEQPLSRVDLEGSLCVMPLMLQSAARANDRDFLRMFRNAGRYLSFFPPLDDLPENLEFLKKHPDLEAYALMDGGEPGAAKQSLLNVFKLVRPVIVLDEAHNAYSPGRRRQLNEFNPRMILELSATPDTDVSNILVDISGEELRREQMIKLPLNVSSPPNIDWKQALAFAKKKRDELEVEAENLQVATGRYIRPIMLIRVQFVGGKTTGRDGVHAEDVRAHLRDQLKVPPKHIRHKTAEKDEIAQEDLLSEFCDVRYIITHNALQEGWDCAFAYVLAILDVTTSVRALTQMTGRVLRQPGAELTGVDALDESYVFCCNRDVDKAVNQVKEGLKGEGLGDLSEFVCKATKDAVPQNKVVVARRQGKFTKLRVLFPRVLHKRGQKFAPLDYESDILSDVQWEDIMRRPLAVTLEDVNKISDNVVRVDLPKYNVVSVPGAGEAGEKTVTLEFFVRYLGDVIPNPFVAAEIVRRTLDSLREAAGGDDGLFDRRYQIAEAMKWRLRHEVDREARDIFCLKLRIGRIHFKLEEGDGYELPMEERKPGDDPTPLTIGGEVATKSLLRPVLLRELNGLERDFAIHLDGAEAVEWWHRFAAHRGYALQGWRRHRVYPDFVACIREGRGRERRFAVLETKGMHLSGNPDTKYKDELLKTLSEADPRALECGEFTLNTGGKKRKMVLRLLLEEGWRERFAKVAAGE